MLSKQVSAYKYENLYTVPVTTRRSLSRTNVPSTDA